MKIFFIIYCAFSCFIFEACGRNSRLHPQSSDSTGMYTNAKTFGAIGDGIHDDYNSLQKAIDYSEKQNTILFIPYGTYKISAALHQKASSKITSAQAKIIPGKTGMTMLIINGAKGIGGGLLEGVEFDGGGIANTGIQYGKTGDINSKFEESCPGFVTRQVKCSHFTEAGVITGANVWLITFENCFFSYCTKAVNINGLKGAKTNNENISFYNCAFFNSTYGLYIDNYSNGGGSVFCYACSFDYNADWSIVNSTTPQGGAVLTLTGCHMETTKKYLLNNGFCTMTGCFTTNGTKMASDEAAINNYGMLNVISSLILRASGRAIRNYDMLNYLASPGLESEYNVINEPSSKLNNTIQLDFQPDKPTATRITGASLNKQPSQAIVNGKYIGSADGITQTITIPHNLNYIPATCNVTAGSKDASGIYYITYDKANIVIHYSSPPFKGNKNIVIYWTSSQ